MLYFLPLSDFSSFVSEISAICLHASLLGGLVTEQKKLRINDCIQHKYF